MSFEERIRELTEQIIGCQDDGKTAVLAEEFQDAIHLRVIHLRHKLWRIPLGQIEELHSLNGKHSFTAP